MSVDFMIEKRLRKLAPELHQSVIDFTFTLNGFLDRFLPRFPNFTDHSILHSLDVLEYSNYIIGEEQINQLNAAECYVLIMACYLHDIGMGVGEKDYEVFARQIDFGNYFDTHDKSDTSDVVRAFHHELSGCLIRKNARVLEFPSDDLTFAIVQASRGHRKTDLFDPKEYPEMQTEYGVIRLPYLTAVVRLADEIDVGANRNPELLFDTSKLTRQRDIEVFGTHESILRVDVTRDKIILVVKPKSPEYVPLIETLNGKIQETLDYCRRVAEVRSNLRIPQTRSEIVPYEEGKKTTAYPPTGSSQSSSFKRP